MRRWRNLTESKEIIEHKEFFYIFDKEHVEEEKYTSRCLPFIQEDLSGKKTRDSVKKIDPIEKKRLLKRWKQSINYYSLNPEKFKFGFKDLK